MKTMMYVCLNSLIAFALVGISEIIEPTLILRKIRYHGVLAFLIALLILAALLVGLLLGAFHE
ncbi:hypothetical protein [Collimonas pratensis]|uniref:Putative membrane protein n=1 Tax=Collimonas pratensis TaxID=279113 RepID=A0A127Q927_9BURK|nr:hypothetical protein [Collimonas pratensis]AMP06553.1 putative membrane protein [Collimonas pratensis]